MLIKFHPRLHLTPAAAAIRGRGRGTVRLLATKTKLLLNLNLNFNSSAKAGRQRSSKAKNEAKDSTENTRNCKMFVSFNNYFMDFMIQEFIK